MPLAFRRPFGFSSAIAFGGDTSAATLAVTLPAPLPALQVEVLPPPGRLVTLALGLAAPNPTLTLSRIHASRIELHPVAGMQFTLSRVHAVAAAQTLAPTLSLGALYDNNVWRGAIGAVRAPMQETAHRAAGALHAAWVESLPLLPIPRLFWGSCADMQAYSSAPHQQTATVDDVGGARFAETLPLRDSGAGAGFTHLQPWPGGMQASAWRAAYSIPDRDALGPFIAHLFERDVERLTRYRWGRALPFAAWRSAARWGKGADRLYGVPWRWGLFLAGISTPLEPPEPPQPQGSNDLAFIHAFLLDANLEFYRQFRRRIPLRRTYIVLHEIAVTRVSDGAELQFSDLNLTTDVGSWGWALAGTALGDATYALLVANPFTEINVRINSLDWRFLIAETTQSRAFGRAGYRVTGVSPALALTAPMSDARSAYAAHPWTMNQLADMEVADTAWTVNWTAPDWLVPGYVWQYSQRTSLQALGLLAEAAGGFVQAERVNRRLRIAPRYPVWPWSAEWSLPSVSWPVALLTGLQRTPKPGNTFNAVYVAGTTGSGIMGYVKRAGTAGDRQPGAPITNTLITHVDGARALGGAYLADHLDRTEVSFSTVLGGDAPLVDLASRIDLTEPGQPDQRLLTEAVSIAVSRGSNSVTVTQSVRGVSF